MAHKIDNSISKGKPAKKTLHVFGKDIYLLGRDNDGINYWLEAPSWDCDWYWGFGYVEPYTNNSNPSKARDISSHQHIDGLFKSEGTIKMWKTALAWHTYTKEEAEELSNLFTEFYRLKKAGEQAHQKDKTAYNQINHVEIPAIAASIIKILTP